MGVMWSGRVFVETNHPMAVSHCPFVWSVRQDCWRPAVHAILGAVECINLTVHSVCLPFWYSLVGEKGNREKVKWQCENTKQCKTNIVSSQSMEAESLSMILGVSEAQQNTVVCKPLEMTIKMGDEWKVWGGIKRWPRAGWVKEEGERKSPQRNMVLHSLQFKSHLLFIKTFSYS